MRVIAFLFAALTLPLAGCWPAEDYGDEPFRCSEERPECPDNYICGTQTVPTSVMRLKNCPNKNNCVCVKQP